MIHLAAIPIVLSAAAAAPDSEFPVYVGQTACLECHTSKASATPCSLKPIPEHDTSYDALKKAAAAEIAALSGIVEPPIESRICLACHATGADDGPRWWASTFQIEDSVQCETCHGAGSFHVAVQRAVVTGSENARPGAARLRRGGQADCALCHVERPSHHEVLELGFRRSRADRLYKTPVNLAISPNGDRLYVVCEHSDSVIVVDPSDGKLIGEVIVGRRPHDAALSPDDRRLFVTNRLSESVSVIDTEKLRVAGEIRVGSEPHGVLVDAIGKQVFVLNTNEDIISVIDADSLKETRRLIAGRGPWSLAMRSDAAAIYVTSVRPDPARFRDPPQSEVTVLDVGQGLVSHRHTAADANTLQGIAWVPTENVALFTLMRTKNLVPITRAAQGWVITNGLGVLWSDGRIDQVLLDAPDDYFPDPMDIAVSPDGRYALVTGSGADEVALVDIAALLDTIRQASDEQRADVLPNHLGMSRRFLVKRIPVGANPRGVLYSPDGRFAYVANALDDTVTVIATADYRVIRTISLNGPNEITQIRFGERLFHSATATFGRQFSCRSCHPDGHTNGLTFDIEADGIGLRPVDNRSLRGIFDTPPFKWEGTNASLHRQCGPRFSVFFTRLAPYSPDELSALVRYMCTIERPPNRYRQPEGLTFTQRRGKAIFDRTTTNNGKPLEPQDRCNYCHGGAYGTNRQVTAVRTTMWFDTPADVDLTDLFNAAEFGQLGAYFYMDAGMPSAVFDAPHLTNIADSAPYLHNGASHTLDEIWTRFNMVNRHGATADLTRQQLNDLIAYLKSQ
ncbi:MAG: beta-propeller fold lactonase family protein [Planctomycetota bacterium]